jgi:hypothetical protein
MNEAYCAGSWPRWRLACLRPLAGCVSFSVRLADAPRFADGMRRLSLSRRLCCSSCLTSSISTLRRSVTAHILFIRPTDTLIERLGPRLSCRNARILPLLHLSLHLAIRPGRLSLAQGAETRGKGWRGEAAVGVEAEYRELVDAQEYGGRSESFRCALLGFESA